MGQSAAQLANLAPPFKPGYDPRRVISNNTGKKYQFHVRGAARSALELHGSAIVERLAKQAQNEKIEPIDADRAATILFDRAFGKPLATLQQTATVTVQTDGERRARIAERKAQIKARLSEAGVELAQFEDITVVENGDSESPVTISKLTDTQE